MILESITLENIRSYERETIPFHDGINFLSGDIGSGKSSILLGIEFALLGFKKGDLEGVHLLRKGTREGSVTLRLKETETGNSLEIYRRIKQSKSQETISQETGYLKVNENLEEYSPQELTARVFSYLHFPEEFLTKDKNLIYRFTVYTPQEQLKEVLFAQNERRLEIIRKLFAIDKYKQLKDAANLYERRLREEKREKQARLEQLPEIEEQIRNLDEEIKGLKEQQSSQKEKQTTITEKHKKVKYSLEQLENRAKQYQEKKSGVEKQYATLQQQQKHFREIQEERERLAEAFKKDPRETLTKTIRDNEQVLKTYDEKLKEIAERTKKAKEISERREAIIKERETLQDKLHRAQAQREQKANRREELDPVLIQCKIKDLEREIKQLFDSQKRLEKRRKEYEKRKEELSEHRASHQQITEQLKEYQELKDSLAHMEACPTCRQEVTENHRKTIQKHYTQKEEELKTRQTSLDGKIEQITRILKEDEKLFQDLEDVQESLVSKQERLEHLKEQLNKEQVSLKELNTSLKEVEQQIKQLNDSLTSYSEELKQIDEQLKTFEETLEEEKATKERRHQVELALQEARNQKKSWDDSEEQKKNLDKKHAELSEALQSLPKVEEKVRALTEKLKELEEKRRKYQEYQEKIAKKEQEITALLTKSETQIKEKTELKERYAKKQIELKKEEKSLSVLLRREQFITEKLHPISEQVERSLFTKYYAELNEEFEQLFSHLIEESEIDVRLDEEFSPVIEQNGHDIDIKNLSGGEKSSLAIAYRLGLKRIIENNLQGEQKLSVLILDEPTDGFSSEQVDRLGELLKQSNIEQILLVSHDEKVESIAEHVIHVEKTNHQSLLVSDS